MPMFSGGQTSSIDQTQMTPEDRKIWEGLSPEQRGMVEDMMAIQERLANSVNCEPVGVSEDGEVEDPAKVGTSCLPSTEQYEENKDTLFKDAVCNPLPGDAGYSCFIPKSQSAKAATENSAKRFKELDKNEDQTWDFVRFGVENALLCGLGGVIGFGIAAWRIGSAVYDSFEYKEKPADAVVVAKDAKTEEAAKSSKEGDAADSKKAGETKAADEKPKPQAWPGKLVIDIAGTSKDLKYVSAGTDIKYQLKEGSEQYNDKKATSEIRDDMYVFAASTAKQIANPGERVTWNMDEFEVAFNAYAMMERKGKTPKQVDQSLFKAVGWATVSYEYDKKQKKVNVFTGKEIQIKVKTEGKKGAEDKEGTKGGKKTTAGTGKAGGGKKKGGKKSGSKGASGYEDL